MKALHVKSGTHGVNIDHVMSWSLSKKEITPELSKGDIYDLTLVLTMINGSLFFTSELETIARFDSMVRPHDGMYSETKNSIGYYAAKARDYQEACQRNGVKL